MMLLITKYVRGTWAVEKSERERRLVRVMQKRARPPPAGVRCPPCPPACPLVHPQ